MKTHRRRRARLLLSTATASLAALALTSTIAGAANSSTYPAYYPGNTGCSIHSSSGQVDAVVDAEEGIYGRWPAVECSSASSDWTISVSQEAVAASSLSSGGMTRFVRWRTPALPAFSAPAGDAGGAILDAVAPVKCVSYTHTSPKRDVYLGWPSIGCSAGTGYVAYLSPVAVQIRQQGTGKLVFFRFQRPGILKTIGQYHP